MAYEMYGNAAAEDATAVHSLGYHVDILLQQCIQVTRMGGGNELQAVHTCHALHRHEG